ncbi:MAG TPA: NUDIX domain-containing protein [Patescibacteria group bacterium]
MVKKQMSSGKRTTPKLKKVLSSGGIVVRPKDKSWEVLLTQHSGHHGWSFPKGHVEIGETPAAAAHREVAEEAGVNGEILQKAGITTYFYFEPKGQPSRETRFYFEPKAQPSLGGKPRFAKASRGKQKVLKNVIYFLMRYTGETAATTDWEVENKEWLALDQVENRLTFETDKKMWVDVKKQIKKL